MYSEENRSSGLAKFLSNYDYVYLDTCSLMEDGFPIFMDALVASKEYWKEGLEVIVPDECIKELKKHSKNKEKNDARIGAKRALKILSHDKWHGKTIVREKGITDGDFGDQAITQAVIKNRIRSKILVITQDKTLTRDLRNLNQLESQHGRNLDVYKITPNGELAKNLGDSGYSRPIENKTKERKKKGFGFKKLFEKPQKTNKKDELPPALLSVQETDKRLSSALGNKNYPSDKKLADINAQIAALGRLSSNDKKKLTLSFTEDRLLKEKEAIIKKNVSGSDNKSSAAKEPHEHFEKPLPKKTLPDPKTLNLPKSDKGKPTPKDALKALFDELGVIVRDDSVTYFAPVHGPLDVTNSSLFAASKSLSNMDNGEQKDIAFADKKVNVLRKNGLFSATLKIAKTEQKAIITTDIEKNTSKTEVKAEPIKKPIKETKKEAPKKRLDTPKQEEKLTAPEAKKIQAEKKAELLKKEGKKEEAPKKTPSKKTVKILPGSKETEAKKTEKTPKAKKAESKPEPAKKVAVKVESKPEVKSSDSLNEGTFVLPQGVNLFVGEPSKRKTARKAPSKVSEEESEIPLEKKMDVDRYLKKETAAPKKSEKAKSDPTLLKQAQASEAKLNANINNSNYPSKSKIRDLEEHKKLIRKLSEKDRKALKFKVSDIDKKLKELKKAE